MMWRELQRVPCPMELQQQVRLSAALRLQELHLQLRQQVRLSAALRQQELHLQLHAWRKEAA